MIRLRVLNRHEVVEAERAGVPTVAVSDPVYGHTQAVLEYLHEDSIHERTWRPVEVVYAP